MPATRFRTGQLTACPYFLDSIPRSAMIAALISHTQSDHHDGHAIRTRHSHEGQGFTIETDAERRSTTIRLED